jgi:hypothetical protein
VGRPQLGDVRVHFSSLSPRTVVAAAVRSKIIVVRVSLVHERATEIAVHEMKGSMRVVKITHSKSAGATLPQSVLDSW